MMQSALNTTFLEGFTKKVIDAYLVLPPLRKSERADLVMRITLTLAKATDCALFSTHDFGPMCEPQDYLIHGPGRYLVKGHGETVESFQEQDERLSFFLKPGCVSPTSLPLPTPAVFQEDALRRDAAYRYTLASHPAFLTKTTRETVELAVQTHTLQLEAALFWRFVFATEDVRTEISVAHAAALLGLSTLTLHRRIGEGKLRAIRASSLHPGIRRAGLEEYIAYRQAFPQGCGLPGQIARYQSWRATWREQYQQGGDSREGGA
jgi:hypothetical protein